MHSNGLVHGNINCHNILVSNENVKILPLSTSNIENLRVNNNSAPELVLNKLG